MRNVLFTFFLLSVLATQIYGQRVVRSVGGGGGQPFEAMPPLDCKNIKQIIVHSGDFVDQIKLVWVTNDNELVESPAYGGDGGTEHILTFDDDEYVAKIRGQAGDYIDQISFITNKGRVFGPFGGGGGQIFETSQLPNDLGQSCLWIRGRSATYVDNLSFLFLRLVWNR